MRANCCSAHTLFRQILPARTRFDTTTYYLQRSANKRKGKSARSFSLVDVFDRTVPRKGGKTMVEGALREHQLHRRSTPRARNVFILVLLRTLSHFRGQKRTLQLLALDDSVQFSRQTNESHDGCSTAKTSSIFTHNPSLKTCPRSHCLSTPHRVMQTYDRLTNIPLVKHGTCHSINVCYLFLVVPTPTLYHRCGWRPRLQSRGKPMWASKVMERCRQQTTPRPVSLSLSVPF